MNKIAKRAWFALVLAGILLCGIVVIIFRYATDASQWVAFRSNPAVQNGGALSSYSVKTRDGVVLVDTQDDTYCEDTLLRKSMVHLLGDGGNTPSYITNNYGNALTGFDHVNGVYSTEESEGEMTLTVSSLVQTTAIEAMKGKKGTVGVYNYQTGEILCMLSMPSFDLLDPPTDIYDENGVEKDEYEGLYFNRFIRSLYIPGSTYKIVTAAAAFEQIEDIDERTFTCSGSVWIGGREVFCHSTKGHGTISFEQALAKSCNVAFAELAVELGRDTLEDYAAKFHIGEALEFDGLKTAAGGMDLSEADNHAIAWAGIGQGNNQINPCRLMTIAGAIAGGGKSAVPYVVREVTHGGDEEYTAETQTQSYLSKGTAKRLSEMMEFAVDTNYSGRCNFAGLRCGGKSGTAQRGDGSKDSLFVGFSSDPDYPLAFVVIVEDGISGTEDCLPIVQKVLNACVAAIDSE